MTEEAGSSDCRHHAWVRREQAYWDRKGGRGSGQVAARRLDTRCSYHVFLPLHLHLHLLGAERCDHCGNARADRESHQGMRPWLQAAMSGQQALGQQAARARAEALDGRQRLVTHSPAGAVHSSLDMAFS